MGSKDGMGHPGVNSPYPFTLCPLLFPYYLWVQVDPLAVSTHSESSQQK